MNKSKQGIPMLVEKNVTRRLLLKWTTPMVASVVLPSHAQMSACTSMLTMAAPAPSKCSGSPPVGSAILQVMSDATDPSSPLLEIIAIDVNGAAATDTITLPTLPASVSDSVGADIEWSGNASDALTCLPLSTISFDITYQCVGSATTMMQSFDLLTVLADALP